MPLTSILNETKPELRPSVLKWLQRRQVSIFFGIFMSAGIFIVFTAVSLHIFKQTENKAMIRLGIQTIAITLTLFLILESYFAWLKSRAKGVVTALKEYWEKESVNTTSLLYNAIKEKEQVLKRNRKLLKTVVRKAILASYANINITAGKYTVPVTAHTYGKKKILKALYDEFSASGEKDLAEIIKTRYGFE